MINKFIVLLVAYVCCCCISSKALAQRDTITTEPWTLDSCVTYALAHNIDIKRKELEYNAKEIVLNESKWAFYPNFSFSTSGLCSSGRVLDQTTYEFIKNSLVGSSNVSVNGSLNIFSGMNKVYAYQKAKLDLLSMTTKLESLQNDVRNRVIAAALEYMCAEADCQSALTAKALLESQVRRISVLVESGVAVESDYLLAKSNLFAAECDYYAAEGMMEKKKMDLCQLLEIKDYSSFSIIDDTDTPEIDYSWGNAAISVYSKPEYRSAELSIEMAKKDVLLAQSAFYPSLFLYAGYGSGYSTARRKTNGNTDEANRFENYPFFAQFRDNGCSYISLCLTIPLFNGMSARNSVKKKKMAVKNAEYNLCEIEKKLNKEYTQTIINCRIAYKKYLAAQERLHYAEEAERQLRERYELGTSDYNDWNVAATELAKARYSFVEAKYIFIFEKKILGLF